MKKCYENKRKRSIYQIEKQLTSQISDNIDKFLCSNLSLERKIRLLSKLTRNSQIFSALQRYIFNNSQEPIQKKEDKEILLILFNQKDIRKESYGRILILKDLLIPNQKEMEIEELQEENKIQSKQFNQ